jgi:hypothetical protein
MRCCEQEGKHLGTAGGCCFGPRMPVPEATHWDTQLCVAENKNLRVWGLGRVAGRCCGHTPA